MYPKCGTKQFPFCSVSQTRPCKSDCNYALRYVAICLAKYKAFNTIFMLCVRSLWACTRINVSFCNNGHYIAPHNLWIMDYSSALWSTEPEHHKMFTSVIYWLVMAELWTNILLSVEIRQWSVNSLALQYRKNTVLSVVMMAVQCFISDPYGFTGHHPINYLRTLKYITVSFGWHDFPPQLPRLHFDRAQFL